MANTKTIIGTTSSSLYTFKIVVTETATSLSNRTSTVKIESYLGRASGTSSSYFGGTATNTYNCAGQSHSSSKYNYYNISPGGWYYLDEYSFTVSNTGTKANPTTINVSASSNTSAYTPNNASSSGVFQLTALHDAPLVYNGVWTENNQSLKTLGVKDDEIVPYLSNKSLKVEYELFDGATLSQTRLYNQDNSINVSSTTDTLSLNLTNKTFTYSYDQTTQKYITDLYIYLKDSTDTSSTFKFPYYTIIPYFTPNIEQTNTYIRRKTDSSTNLTDNKATLTINGSYYKGVDIIGNNNAITIEYKIWQDGSSEPTSYNRVLTGITITGNNISVEQTLLDVNYIKKYHYKIRLTDKYNFRTEITGDVPTGVSVWTEYKDRVDFIKLTVNQYNPFEYSTNETICGVWLGKPLYRKVLNIGTYTWTNGSNDFRHNISNLDRMVNVDYTMFYPGNSRWYVKWDGIDISNWTCNSSALMIISSGATTTFNNLTITLEYTKTTD